MTLLRKMALPSNLIPAGIAPNDQSGWSTELNIDSLDQLLQNPAKLLILDYSRDGSEAMRYQPEELSILHSKGQQVISYLSIGEAEEYRYYFQNSWKSNPPSWLGRINPDWPDNIKVKYWDPEWQTIMLGYLDKVISSGFDGVYLDIIDAFEYWSEPDNGEGLVLDRGDAARWMIDWVETLTAYARVEKGKPNFYIIPQNAEGLLPYDTTGKFLRQISGVGVEDLYYDGTLPQSTESIAYRSTNLDRIVAAGKSVLVIDYVNDQSGYQGSNKARIDDFWRRATLAGYTPQINPADRTLLTFDPLNHRLWSVHQARNLKGGHGNDYLTGNAGHDLLDGWLGNDRLYGGEGNDTLTGGEGNDALHGELDNDSLLGGQGNDAADGGAGNDLLNGGDGFDTLTGGTGQDFFQFTSGQSLVAAPDRLSDLTFGTDKIDLFAAVAPVQFSRAADIDTADNLSAAVDRVYSDADGQQLGSQTLGVNGAVLFKIIAGAAAGTYVVINDAIDDFQSGQDLVINISGYHGVLPGFGNLIVSDLFI